ncbi:hypothetical protein WJX73_000934 [Symbiochloris irregularis]|uniref:Uncharacterized protein n=1 Tax=Symbiochloris irregularis TaxID=706552 RepID=A0AAW1NV60_9CHLO
MPQNAMFVATTDQSAARRTQIEPAPTELPRTETACLQGHEGPVYAVRFNTTGTYCLTGGKDRTIRLWNPHKGVHIKTYTGHGYDVRDIAVSSDNSKLASCGGDRNLFLWDVASGRIIRKFRGHDGVVNAICFGPGDGILVSAGYDQAVRIWDCRARSFDAMQSMKPFADSVTSVCLTDRAAIVAGSVDGTIRRFDVRHRHEASKLDCCLTPSDAHVICGSEDGRVCFWDLVEENLVHTIHAHKAAVCSVAMHPGGECLLTSSTDGTVKVWQ